MRLDASAFNIMRIFGVEYVPSADKDTYGFDGQKNAHAASKPLAIHKVLPAGFSLPERFSAPAKLLVSNLCKFVTYACALLSADGVIYQHGGYDEAR